MAKSELQWPTFDAQRFGAAVPTAKSFQYPPSTRNSPEMIQDLILLGPGGSSDLVTT